MSVFLLSLQHFGGSRLPHESRIAPAWQSLATDGDVDETRRRIDLEITAKGIEPALLAIAVGAGRPANA